MHVCLPDRPSSDRHGAAFWLHLTFVLLLAGFLALWPKVPAVGESTAAPWLALEVASSVVEGDGYRLGCADADSGNGATDDSSGFAGVYGAPAAMASKCFPVGPVLGWQPAPCTLEHARAPPAIA